MIFFDIDDTLIDYRAAEDAAAREFHRLHADIFPELPEVFVDNWRATTEKHVPRYLSGELTFQGQRRERLRDIFSRDRHLTDSEADALFEAYLDCHEKSWRLFSDVESCLNGLASFRLGIISNGDPYQQRRKLELLGLSARFSAIVISGEVGIHKPDPRIFLEACHIAGNSPSECWHVGNDLKADVEGSISAGMNGVWLNRSGIGFCEAVPMIASLIELERLCGLTTKD
jgi:putative hydrolase of the HAD superfamily